MMNMASFEETYKIIEEHRGTFHNKLFEIIDEKGLSNKEVYTRCNIDRKKFSQIQCTADVKPSKRYILALCIGLGIPLEDSVDLLARADKAFNPDDPRDQYVKGFIEQGCSDIWKVNEFLEEKGLELLGS